MNLAISYESQPAQEDIKILGNGIAEQAKQKKGLDTIEPFAFFARDEAGAIRAGCNGVIYYGCLYIDQLWVEEIFRGKGYGTRLMESTEKLGKEKGCLFSTVNTMDWEALDFYKKLGYFVELERTGYLMNSTFYLLKKEFNVAREARYEISENNFDHNMIELVPATLNEYSVIQNMGRFYVYDMSEYMGRETGWEIPENGLYECIDFAKYWETDDAFPFLIRYKNELAGFVIIDKKGSDSDIDFNVAQFFILRKFQNKGFGRSVAYQCFDKFHGTWEVMVIPGNEGAYRFWRSIIKNYTDTNFIEYTRGITHFNNSMKNIFKFHSRDN